MSQGSAAQALSPSASATHLAGRTHPYRFLTDGLLRPPTPIRDRHPGLCSGGRRSGSVTSTSAFLVPATFVNSRATERGVPSAERPNGDGVSSDRVVGV